MLHEHTSVLRAENKKSESCETERVESDTERLVQEKKNGNNSL